MRDTSIFDASDFDIADQIVGCAVGGYNVDPRRIFATGLREPPSLG